MRHALAWIEARACHSPRSLRARLWTWCARRRGWPCLVCGHRGRDVRLVRLENARRGDLVCACPTTPNEEAWLESRAED